jgi:hypothetical protein
MRTKLTYLIITAILLSSCNDTKIVIYKDSKSCPDPIATYNNA